MTRTIELNHHSAALRGWYAHFNHEDVSYWWRIGHKTMIKTLRYSQWIYYA